MSNPRKATLTFLGAAGTVTGSKYLLTIDGRRILVDAGMFQGEKRWRVKNREPFPVDPSTIDDVLLTHAHADHTSYLPALVKHGFAGRIWCTEATASLTEIVLRDSGKLQEQAVLDAQRGGWSKHPQPAPLYDSADVEATLPLLTTVDWDTNVDIAGVLWARWVRAGHILGSASIHVEVGPRSVLFSGDLGRHEHPIVRSRDTPPPADIVLCESTYGDREHPEPAVPHEPFADAIRRTVARGGQVVVPAFAIDRTEAVLRALVELRREGRIPDVPVAVDGPMTLKALDVYRSFTDELADAVTVTDFSELRLLETREPAASKRLNARTDPMIIISSSGMAEGGRVLYHLERRLPHARNTVVLTGYQALGTRGRALEDGAPVVKINGHYVPVKAEVVRDTEFSVHADSSDLVDWLRALGQEPEMVFLVHGEPQASAALRQRIADDLGWVAVTPRHGEVVSLT
ncbi:MAG: MBL fold metallo-hydrolase [Arachnia sp.]